MSENESLKNTYFAPAERSSESEIVEQSRLAREDTVIQVLLDAFPGFCLVLNNNRQIVAANHNFLDLLGFKDVPEVAGMRPGEVLHCVQVPSSPGGCGTAHACSQCGAGVAIYQGIQTRQQQQGECHLCVSSELGHALDFELKVSPMIIGGQPMVLFTLRDISGEKRRRVLERVFFHDVMNTAGSAQGLAQLMLDVTPENADEDRELKQMMVSVASHLVAEIQGQRQLMAAESGELNVHVSGMIASTALRESVEVCRRHIVAENRTIVVRENEEAFFESDPVLLGRVLINLIKNALEATPAGGTVDVGWSDQGESVRFDVHNCGCMPEEVQLQIFQRSFSTKQGAGRGIGTYSIKLFGEQYLKGKVWFESTPENGTTFWLEIPKMFQ